MRSINCLITCILLFLGNLADALRQMTVLTIFPEENPWRSSSIIEKDPQVTLEFARIKCLLKNAVRLDQQDLQLNADFQDTGYTCPVRTLSHFLKVVIRKWFEASKAGFAVKWWLKGIRLEIEAAT